MLLYSNQQTNNNWTFNHSLGPKTSLYGSVKWFKDKFVFEYRKMYRKNVIKKVRINDDDEDNELFFVVWLTNGKHLGSIPTGTLIMANLWHTNLNLLQTYVRAYLNENK